MNTQKSTHNWLDAILIFFVLVNILGDIANIVMLYISPAGMYEPAGAQGSLRGGSMASISSKYDGADDWASSSSAWLIFCLSFGAPSATS